MSKLTTRSNYKVAYYNLLNDIRILAQKYPESRDVLKILADRQKEWTRDIAELDDLPGLPEDF